MRRVWFTADTHFGHGNIIKYCQRPFLTQKEQQKAEADPRGSWKVSPGTVQRHDNALLEAINSVVEKQDTLWIVGDFCWGGLENATTYREAILCADVRFVWGNHDHRSIRPLFQRCMEQGMVKVNGQNIWLNHYPMRSWDKAFHGSWHLYGHVHGRMVAEDEATPWLLTKDVGVDACDYRPVSFEQLEAYMAPRIKAFQEHEF